MDTQETTLETSRPHARSSWTRRIVIGGLAVAALTAAGVAGAIGGSSVGMGGFGMGPFGMERRLASALEGVDATPDQEKRIWAIIDATRSEIRPSMRGFRETRDRVAGLLGGAINRDGIETLRLERIAAIDQASKRMTVAIADAAEVLTADQRAKLLDTFKATGRRGPW